MISTVGILTIDLCAIQSNWAHVNSLVKNSECTAVLKADAYGVGVLDVAPALLEIGCKTFFVANLNEATCLRQVTPKDLQIFVLGGVRVGDEGEFLKLNLVPVLYTLTNINSWVRFCAQQKIQYPCAIKLDTGMSRLGLSSQEFSELLDSTQCHRWLNPILLMSHLACADEPNNRFNVLQLERFKSACSKIKAFFPLIKASLANSSAAFLDSRFHFDMVRIGAALYGINPQTLKHNPLKSVVDLKLPVLQIRTTSEPVSVGYSAEGQAKSLARLAVVAGGYADGLHRTLGLNPQGIVDGVIVPSIGRVSMDTMVFDISNVTSSPEYIQVIDSALTLDVLIKCNKSLGYEVLTSLGRRYVRQYVTSKGKAGE